jgi:polyvinyl alcohol dehydrogenase (cytochrome)
MFAPSVAGVWNPPAIDERRSQLTFGTGDNYSRPTSATSDSIIAVDLNSGKIKWVYHHKRRCVDYGMYLGV